MEKQILLKTMGTLVLLGMIIVAISIAAGASTLKAEDGKTKKPEESRDIRQADSAEQTKLKRQENFKKQELVLLSEFETDSETNSSRDINLAIACSRLDGIEVAPGETFSFNEVIGPCTEEEGYMNAPIIVNETQIEDGIGGGVCQVSTTLYNAALLGNMEIVERKRHSFPVQYVLVGLDSAINYPDMDLKVRNTSEYPVSIMASATEGHVKIQLWVMKKEKEVRIEIKSIVREEFIPEGQAICLTDTIPAGEQQVLQEERNGYRTEVYRNHYKSGILVKQELISEDTYPAVQGIVLEGSSNINK